MKINLKETLHIGGDVFFEGDVFVTEEQNKTIEAELKRRKEEGDEVEQPATKKGK